MKFIFSVLLIAIFSSSSVAWADDVIMATSEDIKEFDQLISKEVPTNTNPSGNQATTKDKKNKDKKNVNQRHDFENHGLQDPNYPNFNNFPNQQRPPPPNSDNKPPPPNRTEGQPPPTN